MRPGILTLCFSLLLIGCDRGPTPANAPASGPEATPSVSAAPLDGVHGGAGAMPAGHPPTDQGLPQGHPPLPAQGAAGAARPPSDFDPAHPSAGGVRWSIAAPFVYRAPASSMRAAEYVVGESGEAVMSVFHFPGMGGSVDANVQRWVGQLSQPDGRPSAEVATVAQRTVNGLSVTTIDVTGDFAGGMGAAAATGQRLLGVIVTAPAGPVFFKLLGPAPVVASAASAFEGLVASLAPLAP